MPQFYLLSVLSNIIAGYFLFYRKDAEKPEKDNFLTQLMAFINDEKIKLLFGAACFVVGLIKLFLPYADQVDRGSVILFGDLLPVLSGISLGVILFFNFLKTSTGSSELIQKAETYILANRNYFGIAGMAVGVLHFLFPGALIL